MYGLGNVRQRWPRRKRMRPICYIVLGDEHDAIIVYTNKVHNLADYHLRVAPCQVSKGVQRRIGRTIVIPVHHIGFLR